MELPKQVTIAGIDVEIVLNNNLIKSEKLVGSVDYEEQKIYLDPNVGDDILLQTYFHELIHYILYVMGKHEMREDEEFTEAFSQLLYQTMK